VAGSMAVRRSLGPFRQRTALGNERSRTAATAPVRPPSCLAPGQVVPPAIVLGPCNLSVYEPVDGLMRNDRRSGLTCQAPRYLLRRPRLAQKPQHRRAQRLVPLRLSRRRGTTCRAPTPACSASQNRHLTSEQGQQKSTDPERLSNEERVGNHRGTEKKEQRGERECLSPR
jgi:hypothetical protein